MIKYIFVVGLILCISCNKYDEYDEEKKVIIKGKISTNMLKHGKIASNMPGKGEDPFTLADAKKVLVFSGLNELQSGLVYSLVDINDGSFTASSEMGKATALVFLNNENKYIGTLGTQGLNILPLGNLVDGESTFIDLSTLTMVDGIVVPSHDPLGNEIIITSEEISSLKEIDGYFESLAQNLDADNDGVMDFLSNKETFIRTNFLMIEGHWGMNNTPAVINDTAIDNLSTEIRIYCNGYSTEPNSLLLTGPSDSPYTDITLRNMSFGSVGFECGFLRIVPTPQGDQGLGFKKGIYTLTTDIGSNFTFDYSNIDAKYNMMIVVPTLHTNGEGKLVSITLEYKRPNNSIILHPENILNKLSVVLYVDAYNQIYMVPYMSNKTGGPGIYSHTLPTPLDISALQVLLVSYSDILGNSYGITWK